MRRIRNWRWFEPAFALMILGWLLGPAHADPITIPGYTVTNLGSGTPTFSTLPNGTGVLNAPNGQWYRWDPTSNTTLTPGQGIMASFPLPYAAPVNDPNTYGNPLNAFAVVQSATMNSNGTVVAIEDWGVSGHYDFSEAYAVQRNANGSWGPSTAIWSGNMQFNFVWPTYGWNLVVGFNNLNQILGNMSTNGGYSSFMDAALYNLNSHTLVDLNQLFYSPSASGVSQLGDAFIINQPIALDNAGRILLNATAYDPSTETGYSFDVLLTPDGLSAAPLEVPATEPGTLATGLIAIVGFITCRYRIGCKNR